MSDKRRPTAADRCSDCALHRAKSLRCQGLDDEMFGHALATETPFWCHGENKRQVCRGWLAIMERRWNSRDNH